MITQDQINRFTLAEYIDALNGDDGMLHSDIAAWNRSGVYTANDLADYIDGCHARNIEKSERYEMEMITGYGNYEIVKGNSQPYQIRERGTAIYLPGTYPTFTAARATCDHLKALLKPTGYTYEDED